MTPYESELEKLKKLLSEIDISFELVFANQQMKIVYNLPAMDRYEADQVIKLAGSALFFSHDGRFMGVGALWEDNLERQPIGYYLKRKDC